MKTPNFIVIKKKKSPVVAIVIAVCAVAAAAAAAYVVYKKFGDKIKTMLFDKTKVLGVVDIDGADAVMLDTTGNGEVDTIILSEACDVCEEEAAE